MPKRYIVHYSTHSIIASPITRIVLRTGIIFDPVCFGYHEILKWTIQRISSCFLRHERTNEYKENIQVNFIDEIKKCYNNLIKLVKLT